MTSSTNIKRVLASDDANLTELQRLNTATAALNQQQAQGIADLSTQVTAAGNAALAAQAAAVTLPKFRSTTAADPVAPSQAELDANPNGIGGLRLTGDQGQVQQLLWRPHTTSGAWTAVGAPSVTAPQVQAVQARADASPYGLSRAQFDASDGSGLADILVINGALWIRLADNTPLKPDTYSVIVAKRGSRTYRRAGVISEVAVDWWIELGLDVAVSLNAALATGYKAVFGAGTYKTTASSPQIVQQPGQRWGGAGKKVTVLDTSAGTASPAISLPHPGTSENVGVRTIEGLSILGPGQGSTKDGLRLEGRDMTFTDFAIEGYRRVVSFGGRDTFIISFNQFNVGRGQDILYFEDVVENSGEKITFNDGTIGDGVNSINLNYPAGLKFINVSADYAHRFIYIRKNLPGLVIKFTVGHIEFRPEPRPAGSTAGDDFYDQRLIGGAPGVTQFGQLMLAQAALVWPQKFGSATPMWADDITEGEVILSQCQNTNNYADSDNGGSYNWNQTYVASGLPVQYGVDGNANNRRVPLAAYETVNNRQYANPYSTPLTVTFQAVLNPAGGACVLHYTIFHGSQSPYDAEQHREVLYVSQGTGYAKREVSIRVPPGCRWQVNAEGDVGLYNTRLSLRQ